MLKLWLRGRGRKGSGSQGAKLGGLGRAGGGHSRQYDAHAGTLVDDHDPIAVTELHHLLCVGVVAGAEGIGAQPAQQVEVLHQQRPVKALPSDLGDSTAA